MRHRDDTGEKLHRIVVNRSTNDKVRSVGCQPLGQKRRLLSEPPRLQAGQRAVRHRGDAHMPPGEGLKSRVCAGTDAW